MCLMHNIQQDCIDSQCCEYMTFKGKADHAQMGVGGVLIFLTLAVSP